MTTTSETLAGLAVAASYRYSQHRTAPSDVNSGPIRAEVVGAQGMHATSAPQDRAVFIGGWRPGSGRGERDECGATSAPPAGSRLRAAFTSIDSTAVRVSGPGESEFPDSPSSAPQAPVDAADPRPGASTGLHGVRRG